MYTNETYEATQGSALTIDAVIRDGTGNAITAANNYTPYTGSETLTTTLWPGGNRAASYTPATNWTDPAAAAIAILISSADTTALSPGRYQLLTRVAASGSDPTDAYGCTVDILASAGAGAAPTTYCGFSQLLTHGRSWLRQLQTDDDEAGFAEQLGRARSWIDDLAHAHFRVGSLALVVAGSSVAAGPRRSGARSVWLQGLLDSDTLLLTDQVKEAAAKKALAFICEGQVGLGDQAGQYARLARMYHSQADYLGTCLTLGLDTDGDGYAEITIDCSSTDPMYG